MEIPFLDLRIVDEKQRSALSNAVADVLKSGKLIDGPAVSQLESKFCDRVGTRYAVAVDSGHGALFLAFQGLGIGPGDEVIIGALGWVGTANAVMCCGAVPVFVDVRRDFNVDPALIEQAIGPKTKAIVVVHVNGLMADMPAISKIADRHSLFLVEDAAQAYGASYGGRASGSYGHINCFSMNPMKLFGGVGEAGMVTTNDYVLSERVKMMRYAGTTQKKGSTGTLITTIKPSLNFRMNTIIAAMLMVQEQSTGDKLEKREAIARCYSDNLGGYVEVPRVPVGARSGFYHFAVVSDHRQRLFQHLRNSGIECQTPYSQTMPDQLPNQIIRSGELSVASQLSANMLCLPMYAELSEEQVLYIVAAFKEFFNSIRPKPLSPFAEEELSASNAESAAVYIPHATCRVCGSEKTCEVLPFEDVPIGDLYLPLSETSLSQSLHPLSVVQCQLCQHLQVGGIVDLSIIYDNYLSRPAAVNPTLSQAYNQYAIGLVDRYLAEKRNPFVVELGSNDGSFLQVIQQSNVRVLGVDPAEHLAQRAAESGIETLADYFCLNIGKKVRDQYGLADVIVANSTLANIHDLSSAMWGIKHLLAPDGVFCLETNYALDIFSTHLLETVNHEHISYFSIRSLALLCEHHQLELIECQHQLSKGGSIRCVVQHVGGSRVRSRDIQEMIAKEEDSGLFKDVLFENWKNHFEGIKAELAIQLGQVIAEGKEIGGYGTSIGATIYMYQLGIAEQLSVLVDDDPYRQGRFSPGAHIPVIGKEEFLHRMPAVTVILAPQYSKQIAGSNQEYIDNGGRFIELWPTVRDV